MIDCERLVYFMESKKMTASSLAKKAFISRGSISNILNGRRTPSLEVAKRIARAVDVPLDCFVHGDEDTLETKPHIGS
jgi:transcriptional regulator with XRE-family HTH domain